MLAQAAPLAADSPLSAIDWLSDTVKKPVPVAPWRGMGGEEAVSKGAAVEDVTVSKLGGPKTDAVGILSVSVTGLPRDFWGDSATADLALGIGRAPVNSFPALQELLQLILLAELNAPLDADQNGALFLARIDKLLDMGHLQQAQALLKRAGPTTPQLFRRWFDVALLTGDEDHACEALRQAPDIAPTFPARIFCLARNGDWSAAAVTLETAKALGYIDANQDALLARFLDPELFEGQPAPTRPRHVTPLVFRMFEAIGEPLPTAPLPRAFAVADLRSNIGWKPQLEAAERLAKTGAIDENQLLGLYTERKAAASGGVWERVAAMQAFDRAYAAKDTEAIGKILPRIWPQMQRAGLAVIFAKLYGAGLAKLALPEQAAPLAFEIGLLSLDYETVAKGYKPTTDRERFLQAIATGDLAKATATSPKTRAIRQAFLATEPAADDARLLKDNRLGEAILKAITQFPQSSGGDLERARKALTLLRSVGLEDTARRAALQLVLLSPEGR